MRQINDDHPLAQQKNTLNGLPISPKQARTLVRSTARVNVWSGAIRSGKTFASSIRWLLFIANAPKGGQLVMVGRTRDSLARNVIAPMQDPDVFGPLANEVKYTSGAPFATIMGRRVYVMGASDSKAEKAIRGMTLAGAYVDEVTILSEEFFTQLLGRMSVPGAQAFVTTNPDNPQHWFKKKYLDRIGPDKDAGQLHNWKAWFFTLDDNPSLSRGYKQSLESEFTGLFYKRFILGQWVAAEGAVFDMWNEADHIVRDDDMPEILKYFAVGIDYGTTNPTTAIAIGLGSDDCLYAVNEWRYAPSSRETRKTDAQLSEGIRDWLNLRHDPYNADIDDVPVVVDPAAASFRVQLAQDGKTTYPANNDVLYGIRTIGALLSTGKLRINERCTGLISEFPGYTWDPKATDEGIDQVLKSADHSIDALRYAIVTTEKRWRRHIRTTL